MSGRNLAVLDGRLRQNRHGCGRRSQAFAAVDNGWSMRRSFVFARPDQGDAHGHKGIALFPWSIEIAHDKHREAEPLELLACRLSGSESQYLAITRLATRRQPQMPRFAASPARRGHEKLDSLATVRAKPS